MICDAELRQHLNLLRTQITFQYREEPHLGRMTCESLNEIPSSSGVYWVGGTTVASSGREIDSVFRVDTDSGGNLLSIYWWINEQWYEHDDDESLSALGLPKEEVFPFDWRFAVPLQHDTFHPE